MTATLIGCIDLVEQGPDFLHLSGWLIRPSDIPDGADVCLMINDQFFANLSEFFVRADLADLTERAAGFSVVGPLLSYSRASQVSIAYNDRQVVVPSPAVRCIFRPRVSIDVSGPEVVSGWIFDPSSDDAALEMQISGTQVALPLGPNRMDVPYGTGDAQKARSFSVDCMALRTTIRENKRDDREDAGTVEFVLQRRGLEVYKGVLDLGGGMSAEVITSLTGPSRRLLRLLITDSMDAGRSAYIVSNGRTTVRVSACDGVDACGARTIDLIVPLWHPDERWTIHNAMSGRSVPLYPGEPDYLNAPYLHIEVRNSDGSLSGLVLDLSSEEPASQVQLRCFGHDRLSHPLLAGRNEAQVWSANGPLRCRFDLSERQLLHRLRGLNPNIAISSESPRIIEFLDSGGNVAAVLPLLGFGPADGRLEIARHDRVSGWAVRRDAPEALQFYDIYVNGIRYDTNVAGDARQDLIERGMSVRGGGFRLKPSNPSSVDTITVSAFPALTMTPFTQPAMEQIFMPPKVADLFTLRHSTPASFSAVTVTVVVPIYNAADDLARCIASVLPSLRSGLELLLIDDASPDRRIGEQLGTLVERPFVRILRNENNMGFTRTANRGIEEAGRSDVILLNSDTIVPEGWIDGLMVAAYSDVRIATATPMSNNAGVFSVPEPNVENTVPWALSVNECSRLLRQGSAAAYPRVPTGNGFCMYVRREALDVVGAFDEIAFPTGYGEENDFCMRALRSGFEHVLDDRTYVYHRRSASFGEMKEGHYTAGREVLRGRYPEYGRLIATFDGEDMNAVRWRCRKAIIDYHPEDGLTKRRLLFVISTDTGGTPQTNIDLMSNIPANFECYVLKCDASTLQLARFTPAETIILERHELRDQLTPSLHTSREYTALVGSILVRHAIDLVHIRHLGWHGADLPKIARALYLPVVFSLHDFYTVCPTIKLLDENKYFCGGVCTSTGGECQPELWRKSLMPPLKDRFVHRWRDIFRPALESADALITTSPFARDLIISTFPSLAERNFRVIPHGRTFEQTGVNCVAPREDEPLRVLVPGSISPAKGSELIAAMADMDDRGEVHFHILGDPGILTPGPNVTVHGRYKRGDFHRLSKEIKPHIGAVLSIWPETYCHTLTELWAAGIPTLGIDIGAVGERIREHDGGWLLPLATTPEAIFDALLRIKRDPRDHRAQLARVIDWQLDYSARYTASEMSAAYVEIYKSLLFPPNSAELTASAVA